MKKEDIKRTEEESENINADAEENKAVDDSVDEENDEENANDDDSTDDDTDDAVTDDNDDPEEEPAKEKNASVKNSDVKIPDAETLSSNRKKIIIEIALAVIAVIALIVAIAVKKKQETTPDSSLDPNTQASGSESAEMIEIDNSVLYQNPPAVPEMVQNDSLDYEALVSEGKMLKLTGENGEDIYVHNYTNNTYFNDETKFDESSVDERIKSEVLVNFVEPAETNRDTAQMYDTVSINYVGTRNGVAFDGGTASDQEVTIGISAYIDGFTEGIVGMKVGETKDVHVTFPEDYSSNPDLAGQPAVFAITLNQIITANTVPELSDDIVNTYTGGELKTAKELRDYYKKNMLATSIWDFIDTDFYVSSVPEDKVLSYYNRLIETLDKSSQQYQMSAESLIGMYYGTDVEEYKKQMMADAVESMRHATLYNAIAAKEGISVSDDDILKLATDYGFADDVEGFKEEYGIEIIHDYILQSNLMDYFITLHK